MINNKTLKRFSIMNILISMFIIVLLVTVGSLGYIVFSNWTSSAKRVVNAIANDMDEKIYNKIDMLLSIPQNINEVNHKVIENNILNLSDEEAREKFFVGVLSAYSKEIYSFSLGTANGEYYGARRNESGVIEIMKNNADTNGNSWYYSVEEDLSAGDIVLKAGAFDPRTRNWYKVAEQLKGPTFSPIYKHFIMEDLTVSFSYPIYKDNGELFGVLGTHILLTSIGTYLEEIVLDNQGYAFIVENNTGNLIGNSQGADNFSILDDGTLIQNKLIDINNPDMKYAYQQYKKDNRSNFLYEGEKGNLYFNVREYKQEGLDWVIIAAVPEDLLVSEINQSILLAVVLSIIVLILSTAIYYVISNKLFKPMNNLLKVSDNIASGNYSDRVTVVRNDEIGKISKAFNKVADYLQYLINNLENTVRVRTAELEDNKNQLQLILDSTAEAIYGIDLNGNCTFCNKSCCEMLGYKSQADLLHKNMHLQIHHSHMEGDPFSMETCKIIQSIEQGIGTHADNEVFWRADGTSFDVEYYSYPQIRGGKVIGAVITFMDITERKNKEEEIKYLSCHDFLTGLHNRRCFEDNIKNIDIPNNLPISIIFADINSLKLTNDIFGHAAGDRLIKKSADILKQSCNEDNLVARIGGDEFIIVMPRTNREEVDKILSNIKSGFNNTHIEAIKCSLSVGSAIKTTSNQDFEDIMSEAEIEMYKNKTATRKSTNTEIFSTLVKHFHSKSAREKQHAITVSNLCGDMGTALNLTNPEIKKLKLAGYLHDIGIIVLNDEMLQKESMTTAEEQESMNQHSVIGYRILNLFDDTADISEIVYSHHERWDGKGYPRGLKGEEIPLLSRIISIVEAYERAYSRENISEAQNKAISMILDGSGSQFEPQLVAKFITMMEATGVLPG